MNSAGVSSGEETWSGFSESEAGHHVEDSFDDIGFTDISPDDNPGSCEQNKCELDSDCESDSELEHDVDEINLNPRHADAGGETPMRTSIKANSQN